MKGLGPPSAANVRRSRAVMAAALAVLVLAVYAQTAGFDFISLDDRGYVVENPHVTAGLAPSSIAWAFTATQFANWHPLTWLSLMLDATIAGTRPGAFHASNVLLHLTAAVLLFLALDRMTGAVGRSGLVAALFAVHPLHVESVAWVAERKDVLSAALGMATLLLWLRWIERPSPARYALALGAFALGLMAKPMLVTLPVVLVLLDLWPLGRWRLRRDAVVEHAGVGVVSRALPFGPARSGAGTAGSAPSVGGWTGLVRLLVEKAPFFVLAVLSSIVTFLVQQKGGAVSSFAKHPFGVRAANATVSTVVYLVKMVWPADLAFFYPHPRTTLPVWQIAGASLVLVALTVLALLAAPRRPYVTVGWLWYVVMLLPVIGLVQVGEQARADRYTYLPLIGPFLIVAWGAPELWSAAARRLARAPAAGPAPSAARASEAPSGGAEERGQGRSPGGLAEPAGRVRPSRALALASCLVVAAMAAAAFVQASRWKDSVTLYSHALAATGENAVAHDFLGLALRKQGKVDEAILHFREAVRIEPEFREAHCDLASALNARGQYEEAMVWSRKVLAIWPENARGHADLGLALARLGNREEGIPHLREALRLKSDYQDARVNLGVALAESGRYEEAAVVFEEAARADPNDAQVRRFLDLARAKAVEGRTMGRPAHPEP